MKKEGKYKPGMKVPEDYFEDFDDRLFTKISEEALPKKSGFKVPDGYIDSLDARILQRVSEIKTVKVIPLYRRKVVLYAASVAASLVLAFAIYTKGSSDDFSLEIADIEAYFNEDGLDFDSYDVAQLLNEEDLDNLPIDNTVFNEETLENYLLENLDDTTLLTE